MNFNLMVREINAYLVNTLVGEGYCLQYAPPLTGKTFVDEQVKNSQEGNDGLERWFPQKYEENIPDFPLPMFPT